GHRVVWASCGHWVVWPAVVIGCVASVVLGGAGSCGHWVGCGQLWSIGWCGPALVHWVGPLSDSLSHWEGHRSILHLTDVESKSLKNISETSAV
ncbi:hypothetical protein EWB00_000532, partial [Schistosoma japonicum]